MTYHLHEGGPMNSGKEGLKNLSFCNTKLICVVSALSLKFPSRFLSIDCHGRLA